MCLSIIHFKMSLEIKFMPLVKKKIAISEGIPVQNIACLGVICKGDHVVKRQYSWSVRSQTNLSVGVRLFSLELLGIRLPTSFYEHLCPAGLALPTSHRATAVELCLATAGTDTHAKLRARANVFASQRGCQLSCQAGEHEVTTQRPASRGTAQKAEMARGASLERKFV